MRIPGAKVIVRSESVMNAILATRLAEVKRLLETTTRKLQDIGESCGFRSQDYLKRLFKSRFGCTMREWRASHRSRRR